jgi:rubrerythrin
MSVIAADATATITNLLTAYEGEVNAHSRYLAFATRADGDGFPGVASLFRAASRAEQIHANNHARVIRELGGQIKCEIQTIEIKMTLENLKTALAGETYEASQMYPGFLEEARAHRITDAIRTLNRALESERVHARLYGQAIGELESGKTDTWIAAERSFYVCPICGYTADIPVEHERCPVCKCAWKRFETIQ